MRAARISAPVPSTSPSLLIPPGVVWILIGGTITGLSPILARISEVGPLATAGWRMLFAALAILPFWLLARRSGKTDGSGQPVFALLAGLFFAIDIGFFHTSLTFTSITHATLIVNLAPVVALGAGFLLFGERFGYLKLAALVLSLGGALAMTSGRADVGGTLEGNALAFVGMFGYSCYLITVKQARRDASVLTVMLISSAVCAAVLLGGAVISGENVWPDSAYAWLVVILLGLVVHAFGQGLVTVGMRDTAVGLASILLLMQPVCAGVFAWLIFDETLGPIEAAGAGAVLLGIAMATRARG